MTPARALRHVVPWLLLLTLVPASSRANVFQTYGFGPRGQAVGNAMTAGADDFSAVHYNPAALTLGGDKVDFGFALTLTAPELYIDRGKADSEVPSALPDLHVGLTFGWRHPLGGIFENKVAIGVGLYLPVARVARVQGLDPAQPQFYMYQNLQDKLVLIAGVAYQPFDWLSFGIGAQLLADLGGGADLGLDIINGTFDHASVSVELVPSASATAGLHFRPLPNLDIGLSYRGANGLSFRLPVTVAEGDALSLAIDVEQTVLWTPHQVSLGISYAFDEPKLRLWLDATLAFWSQAPDPSPQLSVDIGGKLLEALGLQDALDVSTRTDPVRLAFVDTVTPRFGAEWEPLKWFRLRTGYSYRPTPAPKATGPASYLDNDAHVVSLGLGFVFDDPFEVNIEPIDLDLTLQTTILPRRTIYRASPADPVGDMSHGGAIFTVTLGASHRY